MSRGRLSVGPCQLLDCEKIGNGALTGGAWGGGIRIGGDISGVSSTAPGCTYVDLLLSVVLVRVAVL